ncbi:toxin Cry1Ac domain D-VI-related protein [Listeria booriae]|uniref:toxin Cry1Ac domain D-VI-related protein n=1 Tax=Listeria booriae TaxID=1552123 RepID=UPI0016265082|nr:toxin Cry1Ac domain D-VI-related protein [Listeria booriae]MBC1892982.1 hypothetical protein [Listeria booriae]
MKKQDLLKKGTSIALVATIVGSQLLATVPYNVFAAENTVGIQAVPTNSVTVSTWPELQAALTSVAVTDIYLNADITIGATTNITMTTKNIHGNNHILNANSKQLRLTTAGTVALMEDVRITNTDAYGLFWGDVNNLEVTYKNVDHSGLQMIYLPTGHLIIDGTVTSNSTTQEVYQGKDLTIKDNATAYFNAIAGIPIHLLTASGSLNVGKNATLTTRSKGISIYGAANTKLINEGNMDLKSDLNQAILLLDNSSMYFQPGSVLKAIAGDTVEEAILTVGGGIYVESGATFEVESKGTQGTINAGSTIKLAQGSNFSLTNFNPEGSVLGSYPTPANVILQSSQGVSTWDRGTVMNPKPTATYPGMFDAQFTLSGYLKGVTQTNLTSNNMQFINSYKTGATGKIVGGSFASDEQDVAKSAVDALFTDSTKTGIKTTTDQAAIDAAKDLVNKVSDPTVKADLQKDIDKAQSLLDAKNAAAAAEKAKQDAALKAVNELFNSNTPLTDAIKPTTDQAAIDAAKALVNAVTDPTVKAALQKDLNRAQELLDAKNAAAAAAEKAKQDAALKAVNELFNNNTPSTDAIKGTTDQAAINAAKALVDAVTDPTVKAALQKDLNRAQELLDAKTAAAAAEKAKQDAALKAVNELFNNNTPATDAIKGTTDQAAINAAKALVDAVTDPTVKAALQKDLNRAQELLDAKTAAAAAEKAKQDAALKAVNELFNNNTPATDAIKGTTDQASINAAKALVDAVTDPTVKAALQKDLNRAQELLDAKNTALTKPVLDAYHITDEYVTGKVDANTATVELYINGVRSKISTPTNGEFKLYAQGFGLKVGDTFEVRPVDAKGNKGPIATGTVLGAALNLTTNDVGLSATTVTGTVGAGITSVRLSIDGTIVKVGQINADGTYSIATNNLIKPSSKVEVVGYVDKTEMVRKAVNIVNDEKPVLSALTVDDDTVKGSVTAGSATGVRISINGVAKKTANIAADGTFESNIGKQPLGTVVTVEVRDSAGYNSYRTASVTVTPSAVAKLAAPTLTNMDGSYIVGTAPKGTESIVVYEDGVAVRTQNISTMTVNPDGSFTFKAYVAASASQVQVQAKNSDKRMNSDLSATFTK